ncbi:glycosyltransferase family 32 protein [Flagelloscypha sp. PMI_526]|nr:glycosyltransferase family 32 protein [Flagelloscypha sp. PMI_526]
MSRSYERIPMNPSRRRSSSSSERDMDLPVHNLRAPAWRTKPSWESWLPRPRHCYLFLKFFVPSFLLSIFIGLYFFEPKIEMFWFSRDWVTKEIKTTLPLSGCFNAEKVHSDYNMSEAVYGPKWTEVQAGIPMRIGMDCYEFAGTIRPPTPDASSPSLSPDLKMQYHAYWRYDLAPFGPRQEYFLKSFFATQDISRSRMILWSNGDLSSNEILQSYLKKYPDSFTLKEVDIPSLARGTALDGSPLLTKTEDSKAWVDGDLIRLLLLWNYGGVWVDMDSLLTRDLHPLLEHEFVTQWDCYDKLYAPFNGALMRFRKHSPYLCEAFHVMSISSPPRPSSTDWGSLLYYKLYKALIAGSIPPFKILPFCFTDARSCRPDNRLPDPFEKDHASGMWTGGISLDKGGGLDRTLKEKIFSVHLHNQWEKVFPTGGWVDRLLLQRYDDALRLHS